MDRKLQIAEEVDRIELFGNFDSNLDLIREATGVEIFQRDDDLILKAPESVQPEESLSALNLAQSIVEEFMNILASG